MKVFDGVLYNGEADMLECRLWELADTVDLFVIIEGDKSFTGQSKIRESRERFEPWADKIHWINFTTPINPDPWIVEQTTRNYLFHVFNELAVQDGDVVTVCDVDEIWSPSMLERFCHAWHVVMMRHLVYSVHWEAPMELTCVAGPWGQRTGSANKMRQSERYEMPRLVGGWHLGWMGGIDRCVSKLRQFSHQELNVGDIESKMRDCLRDGIFVEGTRLNEIEVASDWPKWVVAGKHPDSWRFRR